MSHADSAGLSACGDKRWRCILQAAPFVGRRHHLQFSSQALPHWAHCTNRMLFVRPQTDCSGQRWTHVMAQAVSRWSFIAEAWARFQAGFMVIVVTTAAKRHFRLAPGLYHPCCTAQFQLSEALLNLGAASKTILQL